MGSTLGVALLASTTATVAVVVVVVAAFVVWTALAFNRLVRERNLVAEGWSGIDVQLKRRSNLIPALVEVVKGYSRHERKLLTDIAELRNRSRSVKQLKEREESENALTDQLKGLFALAEAYPQLKADRQFLRLAEQLSEIEDQLQMARRYYNGAVRNYNIRVESFPSNLVARLFGFGRAEFFQVETATERAAPKVEVS
ncbi:MAG: hypothetical protein B1H04_02215 [Planctomycetales bacterium 4484_123]|nr:MAG: hypothetical protein B1H04_02215 [Planctomycetales bacterium 4484_123]